MRRAILVGLAVAALGGCGGSSSGSVGGVGKTDSTETTSTDQGYHDMGQLAASVKDTYNAKYRKGGPMATDVNCISTGANSAECNADYADGSSSSVAITISQDGSSWISHQ